VGDYLNHVNTVNIVGVDKEETMNHNQFKKFYAAEQWDKCIALAMGYERIGYSIWQKIFLTIITLGTIWILARKELIALRWISPDGIIGLPPMVNRQKPVG